LRLPFPIYRLLSDAGPKPGILIESHLNGGLFQNPKWCKCGMGKMWNVLSRGWKAANDFITKNTELTKEMKKWEYGLGNECCWGISFGWTRMKRRQENAEGFKCGIANGECRLTFHVWRLEFAYCGMRQILDKDGTRILNREFQKKGEGWKLRLMGKRGRCNMKVLIAYYTF
jgi:hypothetical protein